MWRDVAKIICYYDSEKRHHNNARARSDTHTLHIHNCTQVNSVFHLVVCL